MAKLFGGSTASDPARLPAGSVSLFGKHPAWGDHIDNLGDESQFLLEVRSILYSDGLTRQIGTGAWEKLPAEGRLPFNHFFVWHFGGRMINGLLWSSADSRGRTQYPLVLVAETHRSHDAEFIRHIHQALTRAKQGCVDATEQDAVVRVVQEFRESVARLAARLPADATALELSAGFEPPAEYLPRVLHELRASCSHLSASRWSPTVSADGASVIRVPLVTADRFDLLDWLAVVAGQIHPAASLVGFAEESRGIGDLLVGIPTAQNFFCLRAAPATLPFTTDIPFEIASGLRDYASLLVRAMKKGERPARTVFGDVGVQNPRMPPLSLLRS
jgi:hypothetical protein